MGLGLSEDKVVALQRRTEGWVTGLQLAALALRQQDDPAAWIAALTGGQRYLLDYVQEEILQRQPQPLQRCMLQTAVLTRLSASICQVVTGEPDQRACQGMPEALERANVFLLPLDEQRQWYRFHELFREALLARLSAQEPALLPELHLRAARWYEAAGEPRAAIAHALGARDYTYAARLMEQAASRFWLRGEAQTVRAWLAALPDAVLWQHALLALNAMLRLLESLHATTEASYARGQTGVERTMTRLEALLHRQAEGAGRPEGAPTLQDESMAIKRRLRLLCALIEVRAILRYRDKAQLARLAREIEGLSQGEDLSWRMIALASDFWLTEVLQREGAFLVPRLLEAKQQVEQAGDLLAGSMVQEWLAFGYVRAGQWQHVHRECLAALALLDQSGGRTSFANYLHGFLADAYYAWNHLDQPDNATTQMLRIAQDWQQVDRLTASQLNLARNSLAGGDHVTADQALQQAETLVQHERWARNFYPVADARVAYWLATGELEAARQWAEHTVFSPATWDPNDQWAVLTPVKVRLAQHHYAQALELLERFRTQLSRPDNVPARSSGWRCTLWRRIRRTSGTGLGCPGAVACAYADRGRYPRVFRRGSADAPGAHGVP